MRWQQKFLFNILVELPLEFGSRKSDLFDDRVSMAHLRDSIQTLQLNSLETKHGFHFILSYKA